MVSDDLHTGAAIAKVGWIDLLPRRRVVALPLATLPLRGALRPMLERPLAQWRSSDFHRRSMRDRGFRDSAQRLMASVPRRWRSA